ncbi:MAG: hypothetical protein RI885_2069 [Actinomycetota bacterium]|jgi:hypothetical protein
MASHEDLPGALADRPFSVGAARRLGVGEGRLRGRDLSRPFHGVRAPIRADTLETRCAAYLPRLKPGNYFSHLTAAALWGLPLPASAPPGALHVTSTRRAPSGRGVIGHTTRDPRPPVWRDGFPVADPVTLFLQLSAMLSLDDLVAVGDALVLDPVVLDPRDIRPWTTLGQISSAADRFEGHGALDARTAAGLVRHGVESRPETHLRLLAVRSGFDEPEINVNLFSAAGRFLGRGDLVYRRQKVLLEYDGDHHRADRRQYESDIARIERFTDDRWEVVRVRSRGLYVTPQHTVERLARAFRVQRERGVW